MDALLSIRDIAPADLNPRYWAFLQAGNEPCAPGRNARFMVWCSDQWQEFFAERGYGVYGGARGGYINEAMHDEFDRWLFARLPVMESAA